MSHKESGQTQLKRVRKKESETPRLLQPTMLVWEIDPQLLFKCLIYLSMIYNVESQGCNLMTILDIQVKKKWSDSKITTNKCGAALKRSGL